MFFSRYLLAILFLSLSMNATAQDQATASQGATWSISFEFEEHFRAVDNLPRIIHIEVSESGHYVAKYNLISDNPEISTVHTDEGSLSNSQMEHLKLWLDIIKDSDIKTSDEVLQIGYGATLQPGWQGHLKLQRDDKITALAFNSLRSNAAQRPQVANQLVTFILDLKRLTLGKFGLNRKTATAPETTN